MQEANVAEELSGGRLIHELFEEQVRRTPGAVAVLCEDRSLTFTELNRLANRVAHELRSRGVGPDRLVGVCVERGIEMVIGMLAVLKAGGAYVPLDPAYPLERLSYMVEDATPKILLTQHLLRARVPLKAAEIISIEDITSGEGRGRDDNLSAAELGLTHRNLAFVIYTSGSTGRPKGAMNEHRGMVNRILAQREIERFTAVDVCCQKTSMSFVDAVFETFGALCNGLKLVIIPSAAVTDSRQMAAMIAQYGVTQLTTVPSLARAMLEHPHVMRNLVGLRNWTLSGEEVRPDLLVNLQRQLPECEFIVLYGASEVSSDATYYRSREFTGDRVPIGWAVPQVGVYVLDPEGKPVPAGESGEIHVGGVGVGRGYLNQPQLTAQRFIPDTLGPDPRGRLYKTGDLGRWRADGCLECLGRIDNQVKIRGFRIELGEIEMQLRRDERIKDAVVVARESERGERRLIAYFVARERSEDAGAIAPAALRTFLKGVLPDYMVPSAFVALERFPYTPNGKLDRRSLPEPTADTYAIRAYEAPQGEPEQLLATVWEDLLSMERVGRHDNFFELGGHSLLIVKMLERLGESGWLTEARNVFDSPSLARLATTLRKASLAKAVVPPNLIPVQCEAITPSMLPLVALEALHIERIVSCVPGGTANVQDIYPLAPLQEGILFHHMLESGGADPYILSTLLAVDSREKLEGLIAALQTVIDRHDALRTAILWEDLPRPVQVVYRSAILPVEVVTLERDCDPLNQVQSWLEPEHHSLDLRRAPLLKLRVAADPNRDRWYGLIQLHHITCDHLGCEVVMSEVATCLDGQAEHLPRPAPYRDHVAQALAHARSHNAESFFRAKLGSVDEPTAPFGVVEVRHDAGRASESEGRIPPDLAGRVRSQAMQRGVSVATLFHAAWALVLAQTSSRDDVVFGTVLLGRTQGSGVIRRTLGMFINTLPLRVGLGGTTAEQLVTRTQHELVDLLDHEDASLALAQRCSGLSGSLPLFTSLLNYRHNAGSYGTTPFQDSGIRILAASEWTNYPITVSIDDLQEGFGLSVQTRGGIDSQRMVGYLQTALRALVGALENSPHTSVLELSILPIEEQRKIAKLFNGTAAPLPQQRFVHELFEEQAQWTPGAVALLHGERSLTYAELNARANTLARYLMRAGVSPGQVVGICVDRGLEMVIGLLGILKAGAAYLPLDPHYPVERLEQMFDDAKPTLLLTQRSRTADLQRVHAQRLELDIHLSTHTHLDPENLLASDVGLSTRDLVYVIYTSGSTGRPKGTAMPHSAMVNLIEWHRRTLGSAEGSRVLQFAALSFDVAFQEIFSTLCTGGTLVLLDEWVRKDPRALTDLLNARSVRRLFLPPLMLQSLAEYWESSGALARTLRDIIVAGEQLRISPQIVASFERLEGCRLHNHYGPTETHVVTALTLAGSAREWPTFPSIGQPISNTQIHILDRQGQLAPIGVPGEIYIGGVAVARGYLHRSELTAERFLRDPFSTDPQARMYKSGDLGRWRPDGTIEYLGRNDHQVKIRGFRVELGEIEARLASHDKVREVVVIARESSAGQRSLVAYYTPTVGPTVGSMATTGELRAHLALVLPEHMLPSAFVCLDSLPLTASGKVDRRALPAPDVDSYVSRAYEPPQGEVEHAVARLWCELLSLDTVSRTDSFFDLGGHSLLAMQLSVRLCSTFSIELPVRLIFEHPTLQALARRVEELRRESLTQELAAGAEDIEEILADVAVMSESRVAELVRTLTLGQNS